jgi:hypothetical protein
MQELHRQLGTPPGEIMPPVPAASAPSATDVAAGADPSGFTRPSQTRKAKVLYDYDAADDSELSLLSDEVSHLVLLSSCIHHFHNDCHLICIN